MNNNKRRRASTGSVDNFRNPRRRLEPDYFNFGAGIIDPATQLEQLNQQTLDLSQQLQQTQQLSQQLQTIQLQQQLQKQLLSGQLAANPQINDLQQQLLALQQQQTATTAPLLQQLLQPGNLQLSQLALLLGNQNPLNSLVGQSLPELVPVQTPPGTTRRLHTPQGVRSIPSTPISSRNTSHITPPRQDRLPEVREKEPNSAPAAVIFDKHTLFVGNCTANKGELRQAFSRYGKIRDIRFNRNNQGVCFVEFYDSEDARVAKEALNQTKLAGRTIFINYGTKKEGNNSNRRSEKAKSRAEIARERERREDRERERRARDRNSETVDSRQSPKPTKTCVRISNLPSTATLDRLNEVFGRLGTIKDVKRMTNASNEFNGTAFIDFTTESTASLAVNGMDGCSFDGNQISVTFSSPVFFGNFEKSHPTTSSSSDIIRSNPDFKNQTNVFVALLPDSATVTRLRNLFDKYGKIESVKLMYDENNLFKGCAVINYEEPEDAYLAVKGVDGCLFDGRKMIVKYSDRPNITQTGMVTRKKDQTNIFVAKLSDNTTNETLRELFESYGEISSVYRLFDKSNHFRGAAFVDFVSPESAYWAVNKMDGFVHEGNQLVVKYADHPSREKKDDSRYRF